MKANNVGEVRFAIAEDDLRLKDIPEKWLQEPKVWEALIPKLTNRELRDNVEHIRSLGMNDYTARYIEARLHD